VVQPDAMARRLEVMSECAVTIAAIYVVPLLLHCLPMFNN